MTEYTETAAIPHHENTKLALWVFLGGEVVFFTALILMLVRARLHFTGYEADFRSHLSIPVIALNTFVLVTSSYFVVRALEGIREGKSRALISNLAVVLALGLAFLAGQAYEWIGLFREGVTYSSAFGNSFFTVTGTHGLHVLIGLLWLVYVLLLHRRSPYTAEAHLGIENFGLYWHFVDVVWIVLFTLIYLI